MADIFDVIADPTRRDLLQVLLERCMTPATEQGERKPGEMSVGEIVEKLGLSQPTVSKHLRVLRDHGLVSVREEGQHRYYVLEPSPFEELEDWLIPFLSIEVSAHSDTTVFSAWSGAQVPAPLKRVADTVQNPAGAGKAMGRKAAEASFQTINVFHDASSVFHDASQGAQRRVIEPIKKKLGKKDGK